MGHVVRAVRSRMRVVRLVSLKADHVSELREVRSTKVIIWIKALRDPN